MLLRSVDVLDIYVEPFIHSGFRLPNQPYSYYYRSLFSLHNETFSVWIHLLGSLILIGQVYHHMIELSSSLIHVYLVYNCVGACVMLLCSAQAHLFHSRTLADHLRSFYLDYFGINFYGFTSGIVLRRFSHSQDVDQFDVSMTRTRPAIDDIFFILVRGGKHLLFDVEYPVVIFFIRGVFCKTFYRRPYPHSHKLLQCSGVLVLYLYQIVPLLKNLVSAWIFSDDGEEWNACAENAQFWHLLQFLSFVLSGLVFIGRIPERFCPGSFDLFGQSHHAFHFTIFLMAYCQANAVFLDMRSFTSNAIERMWIRDISYTIILLILQLTTVVLWYRVSRPTIEQRYHTELKNNRREDFRTLK